MAQALPEPSSQLSILSLVAAAVLFILLSLTYYTRNLLLTIFVLSKSITPGYFQHSIDSCMDSSNRVDDVSFLRDINEAEPDVEESSDLSTVQIQQEAEDRNNLPTPTVTSTTVEDRLKTEENLGAILMFLMDEVSKLKIQLDGQKDENEAESVTSHLRDDEDLGSISTTNSSQYNKKLQPMDHGRWKASKAAEQARNNFIVILKELDIGKNEDNWNRWVSNFHMLVESLELKSFMFGDVEPTPTTYSELMKNLAKGNAEIFKRTVIPELYQDVLGRIYHKQYPGIEVIHEEEKRRYDAAMVLL